MWVLVLLLTYAFSSFVFRIVERLQAEAVERSRELSTLAAVVEERARLSRELHDGFAQLVAYMLVRIDTVTSLVAAGRNSEALTELERMRSVTDDLYQDVRESISELRTRVSERGLAATSATTLTSTRIGMVSASPFKVTRSPADSRALVAFQLLRITQEALANVRKHAGAHNVSISFNQEPGRGLEWSLPTMGGASTDRHRPNAGRKSFGLAGMRERVESLRGELTIDSQPGSGTRVRVVLPSKVVAERRPNDDLARTTG